MPKIDIQLDSSVIGNISLDPQDIWAHGGPDFPVLSIRTDFGILPYQQYGQPGFKPVTCISFAGEFYSPPERIVARFQNQECHHSSRKETRVFNSQITFAVPLDLKTVEYIEQARNGNVQAAIRLKPLLAI